MNRLTAMLCEQQAEGAMTLPLFYVSHSRDRHAARFS